MIQLYHEPISPNSSRVWITLLEKNLEFELIEIKLNGEQFQSDFIAINPFHHIPALVDDGFNIIESLAIMDYLEAKYPTPAMLPKDAKDLAVVRMVQLISVNELLPAMNPMLPVFLGLPGDGEKIEQAKEKIVIVLQYFEKLLDARPFFASESLNLADITAGTIIQFLPQFGLPLSNYPKLSAWCDRLLTRPSWQATNPTPEVIAAFKSIVQQRMAQHTPA
jgi:glutathione S-transferase